MGEPQLTLFRLLSQYVALKSVFALYFSGACKLKSLLGTGFSFHFRHLTPLFSF